MVLSMRSYAVDYFWVGGSGNWSDITHWVTTSGGNAQHIQPPTSTDDVYFDANSFDGADQVITINVPALARNITWNGITNNPTLSGTTDKSIQVFGSFNLSPDMVFDFQGIITFNGAGIGQTVDFAGHKVQNLNFQNPVGTWVIASPLTVIRTLNIDGGTIDFDGQPLKTFNLNIRPLQPCVVDLSNCNVEIGYMDSGSPPNPAANLQILSTNLDLFTINSTIIMPAQKAEMQITGDKDVIFNSVEVTDPGGTFILNDPAFIVSPGQTRFGDLIFSGAARIFGDNTFTNLTFSAGNNYTFGIGYTQTIGSLNSDGRCDAPINIQSNVSNNPALFNFVTDQSLTFTNIKDVNALGSGIYNVFSGADEGGTNGWTFDGSGAF